MAVGQFFFTNPEAARQAIALIQLQAAEGENASRERIAKEQTASQRYATQSQLADRDKDRAVAREDIASRGNYRGDAATRERANIQYSTIRDSITEFDPPTKTELEATMAMSPQLTDDLKNDLRALRERAYKIAKSNAAMGAQAAKNYQAELKGKAPGDLTLEKVYERMAKDPNIIFDRATGAVESAHRPPREDASPTQANILGATRPGGFFPSAQEMQGLARPAAPVAPQVSGITDIEDLKRQFASPSPAPVAPAAPAPSVNAFGVPTLGGMLKSIPISPYGGLAIPSRTAPAAPRVADLAPPPSPPQPGPMFTVPPEFMPPSGGADPADNRLFQILSKMPEFAALPPAGKQMVLDQVTGGLMSLPEPAPPRVSDFQTVRPEFIPMDDRYVAPQ